MKLLNYFPLLLLLFAACGSSNENVETIISCQPTAVSIMQPNLKQTIAVTVTPKSDWTVHSNDSWLKVSATSDNNEKDGIHAYVWADVNPNESERNGSLVIKSGTTRLTVPVTQIEIPEEEVQNIVTPAGYTLVWHDEFADENLQTISDRLNPSDWTHEVQKSGWVNNERQNYVSGSVDGKRVTELKDGKLRINCFKGSDGKVYSGRVYAKLKQGWQYGYIEARILLPTGKGTWPAFWMMPVNVDWANEGWPKCGEIDIMEEVGCVPNEVSSSLHAKGHVHTNGSQVTAKTRIKNAEGDYHIYAMEWTRERITTYVDGQKLLDYASDGTVENYPYDKPYYIILNLAWGGDWGGMNGVNEYALPVTMKVDYVRVFQK